MSFVDPQRSAGDLSDPEQFGDTEVAGACTGPAAFSILIIAALLFFA